ncbi:MAG: hypothetical protein WBF33_02875 [Candidatus Nitrosopolaris sp.]
MVISQERLSEEEDTAPTYMEIGAGFMFCTYFIPPFLPKAKLYLPATCSKEGEARLIISSVLSSS